MTDCFNRATTNPETNSQCCTQGITYLLPKSNETNIPKNYRPITCLSTRYKILTSVVAERTYSFFDANNIQPSEQKECKKESYSCKDQLLINKILLENSRSCHGNLGTTWIDYRKGFDTWILNVLRMYKISPTIINFLISSMKEWKTSQHLNYLQCSTICENIKIKCGIFQDDSLSPLLFCQALVPLPHELSNTGYRCHIYGERTNYLF